MHKHLPAEVVKERLLTAAETVFSRSGYTQAKLDEIIELADTGKGTLYKYFGNKDDLFYILVRGKHDALVAEFAAVEARVTDPVQRMYQLFTVWARFLLQNRVLWQVLAFEMTGASRGYTVAHDSAGHMHLKQTWGAPLPPVAEARMLRYCELLNDEVQFLVHLLQQGEAQGVFCAHDDEVVHRAKAIFFGLAMAIFHYQDLGGRAPMEPEAFARQFVESVLHGILRQAR